MGNYGERCYLGKGGDNEVLAVPEGDKDELWGVGEGGANYIEVCVHLDLAQCDKAGDGGCQSHKRKKVI